MSFHLFNEALGKRQKISKEEKSVGTWERRKNPHVREREFFCRGRDQKFARAQKMRRRKSCSMFSKRGLYCTDHTAGRTVRYSRTAANISESILLAHFPRCVLAVLWLNSA